MKKEIKKLAALGLAGAMVLCTGCSGAASGGATAKKSPLDPAKPTTVKLWNYYNGDQLAAFDALVSQFNSTVGLEEGIAVESTSQSNIDDLANGLLDAAAGKVGAQEMPNIAAVYAETAYILEQQDLLVDLDEYFTADELAAYVPGFIEEGRMTENGALRLIPVMKSTECFAVNTTDWATFETACGIKADSIATYEDLTAAAKAYYEWTDSLTPDVPGDGVGLYGRDSIANYIYTGTKQLGHEMFIPDAEGKVAVDLDVDAFKTLWDNYYVPFVNGWFTADANYRSEDMKTGAVLAVTSSTSGVSYLPVTVTDVNEASHDISITVNKPLYFAEGKQVAVQQGAGYCVTKGTPEQQYASARFLKWLTATDQNLAFSVSSGYSPVSIAANDVEAIKADFAGTESSVKDQNMLNALLVSSDVYTNEETYTCKPFSGSKEIRDLLGKSLENVCVADRAAVEQAIAAGTSPEEAVAPYLDDANFEAWFRDISDQVNGIVGQ